MTVLAIETSCDETSVAVVRDGVVLANIVSSQVKLHAEYGGVVPELAAREHLKNLLPVARAALARAGIEINAIDAVAATQGPGLPTALLVGWRAAQAVAFVLGKPFLGINHHEAHLYSPWISGDPPRAEFDRIEPNVALVVSGGHTLLVLVEKPLRHRLLGGTVDDAAGECFDKTGKMLGLAYPAGPLIDRLARRGNPDAFRFPRPMLEDPADDFSFSGLKTAVRYFLAEHPDLARDDSQLPHLCASIQAAIVDVLVAKTVRAALREGVRTVTTSGGVSCNSLLRHRLQQTCKEHGLCLRMADAAFCTDNAGMIGALAEYKLICGLPPTPLDAEIEPSMELG